MFDDHCKPKEQDNADDYVHDDGGAGYRPLCLRAFPALMIPAKPLRKGWVWVVSTADGQLSAPKRSLNGVSANVVFRPIPEFRLARKLLRSRS